MFSVPATVSRCARAHSPLVLAILFASTVVPVCATPGSGNFNVTATLQAGASPTLCRNVNPPDALGPTIIVVCSIGATVHVVPTTSGMPWSPAHGGKYRFNFLSARVGAQIGTADSYIGLGTVTTWRVVQIADWDYLEMLMSW